LFDYVNRQKNYKADRRSAANLSLNQSQGAPRPKFPHATATKTTITGKPQVTVFAPGFC
jgi:hypothetical protein